MRKCLSPILVSRLLLLVFLFAAGSALSAQTPMDKYLATVAAQVRDHREPVFDQASMLTPADEQLLDNQLTQLEASTKISLVVVTLQSMDGGQIDDFTNRLYEKIGIGEKGKDRGALLLISKAEHKFRIEVGYGLEGTLTDVRTSEILRNVLRPAFRQGNFSGGIVKAAHAMVTIVAPKFVKQMGTSVSSRPQESLRRHVAIPFGGLIVLLWVGWSLFGSVFGRRRGRYGSGGIWWGGGGFGGGGGGFGGGGGGGFGGFGGGMSGGGGASGGW